MLIFKSQVRAERERVRQEEEKAARIAAEEAELQKKKEEEEAKKNALAAMSMNFSGYQAAREKQRKGKVKLKSFLISKSPF